MVHCAKILVQTLTRPSHNSSTVKRKKWLKNKCITFSSLDFIWCSKKKSVLNHHMLQGNRNYKPRVNSCKINSSTYRMLSKLFVYLQDWDVKVPAIPVQHSLEHLGLVETKIGPRDNNRDFWSSASDFIQMCWCNNRQRLEILKLTFSFCFKVHHLFMLMSFKTSMR